VRRRRHGGCRIIRGRLMKNKNLLIYQGIPVLVILLPFIWFTIAGSDKMLKGEAGIIENLTVLFLVAAIGFCIASIARTNQIGLSGFLKAWLFILIMGAAYFALEEISYGQHMFGWGTAESWKELNEQDETNLHNVHALFDQVTRALLTIGILIGGVILPIYRYFRNIKLDESNRFYWQWPTLDCVTIGIMVILVRPFYTLFETDIINTGETKENLIALFILLYCVSIHSRLKLKVPPAETNTPA
jgi:disulfide bond formation protein DsbB